MASEKVTKHLSEATATTVVNDHSPGHALNELSKNESGSSEQASQKEDLAQQEAYAPDNTKTLILLLGIVLAIFLVALDNTILATAIPRIVDEFKPLNAVSWYGSSYLLTDCSFQLVFGALYSVLPLKGILLSAIFIFEVGSAICGSAPVSVALIIGRAIAGVGAAGIFQGAFMVIAVCIPLEKRPIYNGIFGAVYGVASIIAPLLGGALTEHVSWRWCFYLNLPVGAFAFGTIVLFLQVPQGDVKTPRTTEQLRTVVRKIDPLGLLIFLPCVVCLLLALVWGGTEYPWSDGRIIALFVLFGVLLIAFIAIEMHAKDQAILGRHLMRQRNVVAGAAFSFFLLASHFMVVYYMPLWFQVVKGASPTKSGVMSLPTMLSMVVASFVSGWAITRFGEYLSLYYLSSILTAVGAGIISTWVVNSGPAKWIYSQIIFGAGLGLGIQVPVTVVQVTCAGQDIPAATSFMIFCRILAGAVFLAVAQNAISASVTSGIEQDMPDIASTLLANLPATQLVDNIAPEQVPQIREIFNDALVSAWQIATGLAAATIVAVVGAKRVNFKNAGAPETTV